MCGIVGYVGRAEAGPILLDGLRRLEYRGYDSAGVAIVNGEGVETRKCAGRIAELGKLMTAQPPHGTYGISHTRWATHGKPTDQNAHPHFDQSGKLALVHNGVIENYQALKDELLRKGKHDFVSETDTEVLAHLIGQLFDDSGGKDGAATADPKARLVAAVRAALKQVIGTYGIALLHRDIPDFIVGARRGSPLVLGVGREENFLASDVSAIVAHTRDAVYLNDFDVVAVERDKFEISSLAGEGGDYEVSKVEFTDEDIKKGDYPHYMLKEIFEQPGSVRDAMRGRLSADESTVKLGGLNMTAAELRDVGRIVLTGCGTALHAAHDRRIHYRAAGGHSGGGGVRERVPASQFADDAGHAGLRDQPERRNGRHAGRAAREPAQGLSRARHLQQRGEHDRARERWRRLHARRAGDRRGGDEVVYLAGDDPDAARTLVRPDAASLHFGRRAHHRGAGEIAGADRGDAEAKRRDQGDREEIRGAKGMLFFGRQFNFPVALEAALKMKEITYLFAEGHPSAELKHGIIALIGAELPSVFIVPDDAVFSKNVNNMEQVKARKGPLIAVTSGDGAKKLTHVANDIITVPQSEDFLSPILTVIPLQLLAYHLAVELGRDVDKPRNLAKSVTVE